MPAGWDAAAADVRDEASLRDAVARDASRASGGSTSSSRMPDSCRNGRRRRRWISRCWDEVFAVNVRGVMATIKARGAGDEARGGAIVVMGSLTSRQGHARQCLYTATKHAVLGIVRCTALDLGRYAIRVNALGPGPIATEALRGRLARRAAAGGLSVEDALKRHGADAALGRMASEEDVANAALYLASDLAAGVTGQILPVDAGLPT